MKFKQAAAIALSVAVSGSTFMTPMQSMAAEAVTATEDSAETGFDEAAIPEESDAESEAEDEPTEELVAESEAEAEPTGEFVTESEVEVEPTGELVVEPEAEPETEEKTLEETMTGEESATDSSNEDFEESWRQDENGKWRYYTSEDEYYVSTDVYCPDINGTEEWKLYFFNEEGYLVTSDWVRDEYDDIYYVDQNGQYVTGVQTINGTKYYFWNHGTLPSYSGVAVSNQTLVVWDEKGEVTGEAAFTPGEAANINGKLYCYVQDPDSDEEYAYVGFTGIAKYGDDEYYFNDGSAEDAGLGIEFDGYFIVSEYDGKITSKTKIEPNTWITVDNYKYYFAEVEDEDGSRLQRATGLYEIDGVTYFFDGDNGSLARESGYVYTDGKIYVWNEYGVVTDTADIEYKKLIKVGDELFYIIGSEQGEEGTIINGATGVISSDGNEYYFDDGRAEAGLVYDVTTGNHYYADPQTHVLKTGWVKEVMRDSTGQYRLTPDWYYMGQDRAAVSGWSQDGNYYFDQESHIMVTGIYVIDGKIYVFDKNGKLQPEKTTTAVEGWNEIDGIKFYVQNGAAVRDTFVDIDGTTYAFDYSGYLANEGITWVPDSEYENYFRVVTKEDGSLARSEWVTLGDEDHAHDVYAHENGNLAEGWLTIDGNTYYFFEYTGLKAVGKMLIDGSLYEFASDGKLIGKLEIPDGLYTVNVYSSNSSFYTYELLQAVYYGENGANYSGWKTIGDDTYYFLDGLSVTSGHREVDDYSYLFDEDSKLIRNGWWQSKDDDDGHVRYYYADADGRCVFGWQTIDGDRYYFSPNLNYCYTGLHNLNGNYDMSVQSDSDWQLFGTDGKWIRDVNGESGLLQEGDQLYYIGERGWVEVDGKYYYVSEDNVVLRDTIITEWPTETTVAGIALTYQYYLKSDGTLAVNEEVVFDGTTYFADANGVLTRVDKEDDTDTPRNGWIQEGENKYYYKDNKVTTGWQQIDNKWYYMDSDGAMTTGWQQIGGKWYYMSSDGVMTTGWQKVGGKWYYMSSGGVMTTGWQQIGGKWYYMSSGGVMTTGWQQISGKWYYMNSGGVMTTGWQQISGKWYYMNSGGVMTTGWQQIGGKWYYMSSSGVMTTGWQQIGGKWYYMSSGGVMVTGSRTIGSKIYNFNASGVCLNP